MPRDARDAEAAALELEELPRPDVESEDEEEALDDAMSVDSEAAISFEPGEEKRLVRKLDRGVVGLIAFLYLLSFLDRSNIGNAKIAGLVDDLKLSSSQFEWLLTAFYLMYITFEWMALLFKLVRPHIYMAIVVCSWGVIASLQSITSSFGQLVLLRALLGIGEAAFCGVPFYLSFFYKRKELAFRTGLFISAAPLATTFASSIAWFITSFAGLTPIAPWRMLFLVEGFPSILVAVYCWHHIADSPGEAAFLTSREQTLAVQRLKIGEGKSAKFEYERSEKRSVQFRQVAAALKEPKSYLVAAMYFCCNVAFASMPVFLPTIIKEMGHSSVAAQALSAPPYLFSFVVVLAAAWMSDRRGARARFVIVFAATAAFGYTVAVIAGILGLPHVLRYLALYLACAGFFTCITIILTWTLNNQESESGKGTGIALLQFIGQCGPLVGTRLFPAADGPLYTRGLSISAGCMATVALLAFVLARLLQAQNARILRQAGISDSASAETHAIFTYII